MRLLRVGALMADEVLICVRCPWMDAVFETVPAEMRLVHTDRTCPECMRRSVFAALPLPQPGQWPCQTEVFGAAMGRALPPRLVPFLYRLLRDGASNPGQVEQIGVDVAHHKRDTTFTNPHLEQYALALAVFLIYQPNQK